jgi:hypothetical protein
MKIIYTLLVVSILIISSCGIGNETVPNLKIDDDGFTNSPNEEICKNNSSFHGNTSGVNQNWYVVKFSSPSIIHVDELHVRSSYKCERVRTCWSGFALTNLTGYPYYAAMGLGTLNKSELFFHINIGSFNYTYDYLARYDHYGGTMIWWRDFNLSSGTWYLICFAAETVECKIEVWINTTGDTEFLATTEGTDTFVWSSEEFLGNFNIRLGCYMIGVINGRKEIEINNTFVGFFFSGLGWGAERLQYIDPNGNLKKAIVIHEGNHKRFIGDFNPLNCIMGKKGVWKFRVDLFLIGGMSNIVFSPWMCMVGADIKLP